MPTDDIEQGVINQQSPLTVEDHFSHFGVVRLSSLRAVTLVLSAVGKSLKIHQRKTENTQDFTGGSCKRILPVCKCTLCMYVNFHVLTTHCFKNLTIVSKCMNARLLQ